MRKKFLAIFVLIILFAMVGCQNTEKTEGDKSETKEELVTISDNADFTFEVNNKGGYTVTGFAEGVDKNTIGKIIVPNMVGGTPVTIIGESAFANCYNAESIRLPYGIKHIESYAFRYCQSLKNLVIPDGVTEIGVGAFEWCSGMTWIEIPDSVTWIGNNVFLYCESWPIVVASEGSEGERYARLVNFEVVRTRPEE